LQDLQQEWRRRVTRARSSSLLPRLVDALFASPIITIPQAQKLLGITYASAQRNVEKLVQEKILFQYKEVPYGKVFIAGQILLVTGDLEA